MPSVRCAACRIAPVPPLGGRLPPGAGRSRSTEGPPLLPRRCRAPPACVPRGPGRRRLPDSREEASTRTAHAQHVPNRGRLCRPMRRTVHARRLTRAAARARQTPSRPASSANQTSDRLLAWCKEPGRFASGCRCSLSNDAPARKLGSTPSSGAVIPSTL